MNNIRLGEREVIETQDVTITLSFKNSEPMNEFTRLIQDEIDKQDLAAHDAVEEMIPAENAIINLDEEEREPSDFED